MMGALAVTFVSFKWVLKCPEPIWEDGFHISKRTEIDKALLGGDAIFGVGWGMSWFSPEPAISSLGLGNIEAVVMVARFHSATV